MCTAHLAVFIFDQIDGCQIVIIGAALFFHRQLVANLIETGVQMIRSNIAHTMETIAYAKPEGEIVMVSRRPQLRISSFQRLSDALPSWDLLNEKERYACNYATD